eukprot:554828-Prymnesium_polylepis.1
MALCKAAVRRVGGQEMVRRQTNKPPKGHADEPAHETDRHETNEDKRNRPPTRKEPDSSPLIDTYLVPEAPQGA